jgi:hypothetical protein
MQGLAVVRPRTEDPSRLGGIPVAMDELQKIIHGLDELTFGLRSRLSPVLRDDDQALLARNSSAPETPRAPLEHQLRLCGDELQEILANVDYILKHLEV